MTLAKALHALKGKVGVALVLAYKLDTSGKRKAK
jgi:hypothetical protein